ncbi:B12-binding domain-containing radical SAM protein [uncultured Desulfobacter sp.]|uniref:B12-binding domain-containing radical SAM protein n=1 Tax=uncultured Desulfobacter sp. TaxID=240139 RepID=UPI002AAB7309|nr:radical SAM protein [uncultured Desulfobacter sp.]
MKILFIYTDVDTNSNRRYPYSIGALSGFLKKHGYETRLLYIKADVSEEDLLYMVWRENADLIAFSTVTFQWELTRQIARSIKKKFDVPIICGGVHATFMPEEVISEPSINMICIGEGEYVMLDLLERMENNGDLSTIQNIWIKNESGKIFRNEVRPLLRDLDSLPFPDREIVPYAEFLNESRSEPAFMTSRGCPFNCTYCSNSAYKVLYKGKGTYVRQRSPENVIKEIAELRSNYSFDSLNFYDEIFGIDLNWLTKFCGMYKSEFGLPFGIFVRAEAMDRDRLHLMRDAGLTLIYIGVESGNDDIRRNVMRRKVSKDRIIKTCRDAQAEGIQVWTLNMIGVPGETPDTIKETMELNRIIDPSYASVAIYQPLPGTELFNMCVENNYIKKAAMKSLYSDTVLAQIL